MPTTIDPRTLVSTARTIIMDARGSTGGVVCPCCDQLAKTYRRQLTLSQVKVMAAIYSVARKAPVPTAHWVKVGMQTEKADKKNRVAAGTVRQKLIHTRGGDYAKARWWGLIEQSEDEREDGSDRAGMWRITERGIDFLLGQVRVPKYVLIYNNQLLADQPPCEMMGVYDVAKQFDFRSIMDAE